MKNLLAELNSQNETKRKVQRANGIKNQAGALNDLDEGPNVRYLRIPYCPSDVPKVRLHDLVLNIQPKTGAEEVPPRRPCQFQYFFPPRRNEQSQNLKSYKFP